MPDRVRVCKLMYVGLLHRDSKVAGLAVQIVWCNILLLLLRTRERLRSIAMSTVCLSVCLSACLPVREDIPGTTRAIFTSFLCMLPMSVARSSSGMLTIGRIAYWWEGGDGTVVHSAGEV